jgi:triphosphoribosyl-dephospho-CoA synthase
VALAQTACVWEVLARKVGNVHPTAAFEDASVEHFLLSAIAISLPLQDQCVQGVGLAIWGAVESTREMVGHNTNLGILLLLAPLLAVRRSLALAGGINGVLGRLTVEDAECVYKAIRLANPGGLGDASEQDVRDEPTVTLLEAMRLAADRDMVARQYANGFADVFEFGTPAFLAAFRKFGRVEPAVIECQLWWLAEHPDSLIARKNGPAVAADVQRRAADVLARGGLDTADGRAAGVALDRHLRSDGHRLNPGTTADLVTACLFVALRENHITPAAPFRWDASDWL